MSLSFKMLPRRDTLLLNIPFLIVLRNTNAVWHTATAIQQDGYSNRDVSGRQHTTLPRARDKHSQETATWLDNLRPRAAQQGGCSAPRDPACSFPTGLCWPAWKRMLLGYGNVEENSRTRSAEVYERHRQLTPFSSSSVEESLSAPRTTSAGRGSYHPGDWHTEERVKSSFLQQCLINNVTANGHVTAVSAGKINCTVVHYTEALLFYSLLSA